MFQQDGTPAHQHVTPLIPGVRVARNASSSIALVSVYAEHISSTNSDNFEPIRLGYYYYY